MMPDNKLDERREAYLQLTKIEDAVILAAREGKSSIQWGVHHNNTLHKMLLALDYTCSWEDSASLMGDYYLIKW